MNSGNNMLNAFDEIVDQLTGSQRSDKIKVIKSMIKQKREDIFNYVNATNGYKKVRTYPLNQTEMEDWLSKLDKLLNSL